MVETFILSITSFVGTNIDDIFINTLFFTEAKTKADNRNIVIGKYLGIGALILLSVLGAFGLQFLPQQYIGYLGFVPIGLGIKEIIVAIKSRKADKADEAEETAQKSANKVWNTALITMANGADNIGVYIPLFAGFAVWQILLAIYIFTSLLIFPFNLLFIQLLIQIFILIFRDQLVLILQLLVLLIFTFYHLSVKQSNFLSYFSI